MNNEIDYLVNNFNWRREGETLRKTFVFNNFAAAVSFLVQVAFIAESLDHHPDLYLHDYKFLDILTTTHSENKLTVKDIELIKKIETLNEK